jgi:hypothetical protein
MWALGCLKLWEKLVLKMSDNTLKRAIAILSIEAIYSWLRAGCIRMMCIPVGGHSIKMIDLFALRAFCPSKTCSGSYFL